jgi:hypothetical protein
MRSRINIPPRAIALLAELAGSHPAIAWLTQPRALSTPLIFAAQT